MKPIRCHDRFRTILSLLKEHGPLSVNAFMQMIDPPMKKRKLRGSLSRLIRKGWVNRRHERRFGGAGHFYQLAQSQNRRREVAEFLGCDPMSLHQPEFHSRELLHAESCALWANYLRKLYPDSEIIRDFKSVGNDFVRRIMFTGAESAEGVAPDLLLIYRGEAFSGVTKIAFEIERTQKKKDRLRAKLRKYAVGTRIDGLVYICSTDRIEQILATIYKEKIAPIAHRINHYGAGFLLLGRDDMTPSRSAEKMVNSNFQMLDLHTWMQKLTSSKLVDRDDQMFMDGASGGPL